MKRFLAALLAASMTLAGSLAMAEGSVSLTLTGAVVAKRTVSVTAPFGGVLKDYAVRAGDIVSKDDALFTLGTTAVYAPCDGTVGSLRALPGDDASVVESRYGALLYIESTSPYTIDATTGEAYDKNDNRIIHVGEQVYLRSVNNYDRVAEGFVTKVDGKNYSVEVTGGNLRVRETARIYRQSDYAAISRIGAGMTSSMAPIPVTAEGSVLAVHVKEGQGVRRGDLLMEMVAGTLEPLAGISDFVSAPEAGIIEKIDAAAGTQVSIDQVLATILPLKDMQIAVAVNETDLSSVHVGGAVTLTFDGMKEQSAHGTVASISALSNTQKGDAEYTAYIDFEPTDWLRQGMSVTVTFMN